MRLWFDVFWRTSHQNMHELSTNNCTNIDQQLHPKRSKIVHSGPGWEARGTRKSSQIWKVGKTQTQRTPFCFSKVVRFLKNRRVQRLDVYCGIMKNGDKIVGEKIAHRKTKEKKWVNLKPNNDSWKAGSSQGRSHPLELPCLWNLLGRTWCPKGDFCFFENAIQKVPFWWKSKIA